MVAMATKQKIACPDLTSGSFVLNLKHLPIILSGILKQLHKDDFPNSFRIGQSVRANIFLTLSPMLLRPEGRYCLLGELPGGSRQQYFQ